MSKEFILETILKEAEVPVNHIETLISNVEGVNIFGFAEIQIDNEPMGMEEVKIELKHIGIETIDIICYDSHEAEDLPDDWFDDYLMKFAFIGKCENYEAVKQKAAEHHPSYILEYYSI